MKDHARISIASLQALLACMLLAAPALAQTPGNGPMTLTIDQAVQMSLERNLNITLAQSQVETSSAQVTGAFGAFLPQININAGYNKQLTASQFVIDGVQLGIERPDASYSAQATAGLVLFDGFSRTANYKAARATFDASYETLNRTRQDIAFQVRTAFLNALRSDQIIEIRRSDLDLANERLEQTRGLVEGGTAQIGEVYSQEAEVANAELSLEQARTDALINRNNLILLLNLDPNTDVRLSSEGLASSVDSAQIASARAEIGSANDLYLRQAAERRDIKAARLRAEASSARVTAARAGYFPTLSTSLGWYWQKSGTPDATDNLQFGLSLQYSPFDGFRTSEQVQLAEAQRQSDEIDLRRLEIQARSDIQQALARLDGAERQIQAAAKSVAAARQSRYAADERYKLGAGSYADYLLANAQYLTAQINQVNAVFNYRMALFEVHHQMGE
jgi:outer membrane protein